jgi:hypothetical protein
MATKRITRLFFALGLTALWIFRDAAATVCPSQDNACRGNVGIPCTGSKDCVQNTITSPAPGGHAQCSDGTSAAYWKAAPPDAWIGCTTDTRSGSGACPREAATCETLTLYKTNADCTNNANACLTDPLEECKASDTATKCPSNP